MMKHIKIGHGKKILLYLLCLAILSVIIACDYHGNSSGSKYVRWGAIDANGKIVVPIKYKDFGAFKEGDRVSDKFINELDRFLGDAILLKKDGRVKIVDKNGSLLFKLPLKEFRPIYKLENNEYIVIKDIAIVIGEDNKYGLIDNHFNLITRLKYDGIINRISDNLIVVFRNNKCGFIDKHGKIVIPIKYDSVWVFSDGLARVYIDGKHDLYELVLVKLHLKSHYGNFPLVYPGEPEYLTGKSAFINTKGEIVIPFKYDYAEPFKYGCAVVVNNYKYGLIDKNNKTILPCKYYRIDEFYDGNAKIATKSIFNIFK